MSQARWTPLDALTHEGDSVDAMYDLSRCVLQRWLHGGEQAQRGSLPVNVIPIRRYQCQLEETHSAYTAQRRFNRLALG